MATSPTQQRYASQVGRFAPAAGLDATTQAEVPPGPTSTCPTLVLPRPHRSPSVVRCRLKIHPTPDGSRLLRPANHTHILMKLMARGPHTTPTQALLQICAPDLVPDTLLVMKEAPTDTTRGGINTFSAACNVRLPASNYNHYLQSSFPKILRMQQRCLRTSVLRFSLPCHFLQQRLSASLALRCAHGSPYKHKPDFQAYKDRCHSSKRVLRHMARGGGGPSLHELELQRRSPNPTASRESTISCRTLREFGLESNHASFKHTIGLLTRKGGK